MNFVCRPQPGATRPAELDELTDGELEVLKLVARGLSNAEIAAKALPRRGDRPDSSRTLTKLGLRDRTQGVVIAYESGLVEPGELTATT